MGASAAPSSTVQCYVNRATEFGYTVLAFVAPSTAPANDTDGAAAEAAAPARKATPEFKWLHVANTGNYKGHHQGEFTLTDDTFRELIANFRADPKFGNPDHSVGPVTLDDGSSYPGIACKVVQYDYEHASEMMPTEGSIPSGGAPAIGWALDLDLRKGADGRGQLWALSKLGKRIREQIDADEYNSVSIAWNPAGVHWITGKPIGAVLTSIAFTNHPFIRDLVPLAAANRAAGLGPAGSVQTRAQHVEAHAGSPPSTNEGLRMTALSADLRTTLCRLFNLNSEASDGAVIRAAENAATASADLAGLLKSLGHSAAADALSALPDLMASRGKLTELLAQFDALMRADATADGEVETQDVSAAFSAKRFTDPSLLASLASHRSTAVQAEISKLSATDQKDVGKVRLARHAGRIAFLTHFGVPTNPAQQHLTQTFVAGPGVNGNSQQFMPMQHVHASAYPGSVPQYQPLPQFPQSQPIQLSQQLPQQNPAQGALPDLSVYEGNLTQRIMQHLSASDAGFSKLDIGTRVRRASDWRKAHQHLLGSVAA